MTIMCDRCGRNKISEYHFRRGGGMYVCAACKLLLEKEEEKDGQVISDAITTEEKRHDAKY